MLAHSKSLVNANCNYCYCSYILMYRNVNIFLILFIRIYILQNIFQITDEPEMIGTEVISEFLINSEESKVVTILLLFFCLKTLRCKQI